MKSGISANQLWTQTPVAARLIEVNTKTGFSLTAGSYSVRASSMQSFHFSISNTNTEINVTITAVTLTRATVGSCTWTGANTTAINDMATKCKFASTTSVNQVRGGNLNANQGNTEIVELF
jgi:hypothetical protein